MKSSLGMLVLSICCMATWAAADECCQNCRCQSACQKTCRLVCETKKVTKVTYTCECEEFCVPGPSQRCVTHDACGEKHVHYTPTCAQLRTRVKPVKHETTQEVPSYRWVVESLCAQCAAQTTNQSNQLAERACVSPPPSSDTMSPQRLALTVDSKPPVAAGESQRPKSQLQKALGTLLGKR